MSRSAVVLCPGRGSYTASELGYFSKPAVRAHDELFDALDGVDAARADRGDLTLRGMDAADSFDPTFFRGENASALTFACTAFDFLRLDRSQLDIVAIGGNSLGWYSALYCAGALPITQAFRLVETMGGAVRDEQIGAQLLYPLVDDTWNRLPEREAMVQTALDAAHAAGHQAGWSIRYGGFAVLWGDAEGATVLAEQLPEHSMGSRKYPLTLPGHSAFHSPLLAGISEFGLSSLADLPWSTPTVPLIDGCGEQWSPYHADPRALARYTLDTQVVSTFDFTATVRVALREYAPEILILLGPGDSLGAAVAQVLIAEGWQGIDSREAFLERQASDPLLLSLARDDQAEMVVAGGD